MRFGKEETSIEEKRRRLRRLVPSWSFLTRLRRPYLFRLAGKDRGEKGTRLRLVLPASEFRWEPIFQASFHTVVTLRASRYAPPDTGVPNLKLVALERLPPIEGAVEIRMYVTFLRGVTSPPRFARHLPLTRGGFFASAPKAPLVKGSWRAAPEGLAPPQRMAPPMRGSCRRRRLMR